MVYRPITAYSFLYPYEKYARIRPLFGVGRSLPRILAGPPRTSTAGRLSDHHQGIEPHSFLEFNFRIAHVWLPANRLSGFLRCSWLFFPEQQP